MSAPIETLVQVALSPHGLTLLVVVNVAVLLMRLALLAATSRRLRRAEPALPSTVRKRRRLATRGSTMARGPVLVAVVLILIPHVVVGLGLDLGRRTLDQMLPATATEADLSDPASTVGTSMDTAAPGPPAEAAPGPPAATGTGVGVATGVTMDETWDLLLIGLDAGDDRTGARNDANLVVRIDPSALEVTLIGIPRNLVRVPDPASDDDCRCFERPLYALYGHGRAHPERYPGALDPGAEAVRQAIGELLGHPIDAYVAADMAAFRNVVDTLGGVEVELSEDVAQSFTDPEDVGERIAVDVGPGHHHFDGASALAYARARADSDDYRRMERQRCLVASGAPSFDGLGVAELLRLAASARGHVVSDLPRRRVAELLRLAGKVWPADVRSLGLVPPEFTSGYIDGYPEPDLEAIRSAIAGPAAEVAPGRLATEEC